MMLRCLEERLHREAPNLKWKCEPVTNHSMVAGTNLPAEIQIRAMKEGSPGNGRPFFLSGECLLRWGVDASAAMICNELTPTLHATRRGAGLDWDRLAEI